MIYDSLTNSDFYFSHGSRFFRALEFIKKFKNSKPDGRYEIDGADIYAIVSSYRTKPAEQQIIESHRKYTDIQVILKGCERIDAAILSDCFVIGSPYDENRDAVYYKAMPEYVEIGMRPGFFAVFYPQDVHRPACNLDSNVEEIRKIVIKVSNF